MTREGGGSVRERRLVVGRSCGPPEAMGLDNQDGICTPGQGVAPGNPKLMLSFIERLAHVPMGRFERQLMIWVLAYQRHSPMDQSCGRHQMQGVWGAARPPGGEREGGSPLACARAHIAASISREREGRSPLACARAHIAASISRELEGQNPLAFAKQHIML